MSNSNNLSNTYKSLRRIVTADQPTISDCADIERYLRHYKVFATLSRLHELFPGIFDLPDVAVGENTLSFEVLRHASTMEPLASLHASSIGRYTLCLPQAPTPTIDHLRNGWRMTAQVSAEREAEQDRCYDANKGLADADALPDGIRMLAVDLDLLIGQAIGRLASRS